MSTTTHTLDQAMAQAQARAEFENAAENYRNPPADWDRDDIRWAYEAMMRAAMKLRAFDVVG